MISGTPVVLGLGSNRSLITAGSTAPLPPDAILFAAFKELSHILTNAVLSPMYRTKALYVQDQDDFYNAVVFGYYDKTPRELLGSVNVIETLFGRDRSREQVKGPRTLDIDIELFGNCVVREPDLIIPHALLNERAFVLYPLLDLLPDCADPISGECFKNILKKLPDQGVFSLSPDRAEGAGYGHFREADYD